MTTDVINGVPRDWLKQLHRDLDACQKLIWANLRGCDPAYCADAQARLAEIETMLATAQPADHSEHALNMAAQPAADGEREAFEAGINPHCSKRNEHGDYVVPEIQDRWDGWQARAAQPQQAVAGEHDPMRQLANTYKATAMMRAYEVRRLREALERAKDHLSHARHDVEVRANAGNEAARLVLAGIDHWLDQEAAHKTGEEE